MKGPHHKLRVNTAAHARASHKQPQDDHDRATALATAAAPAIAPTQTPTPLPLWPFTDIEPKLIAHAEATNQTYDPKHPLACLPPTAAKHALDQLGTTIAEAAKQAGFSYSTAAGWFSAKRNPSRAIVADNIYPALCEAYAANYKRWTPPTSITHERANHDEDMLLFDALAKGEPLTYKARRAIGRRILILLTQGAIVTHKDARLEHQVARENFSRSCLRMAACMLQGEDLNAAAHMIMSVAGARQHHAPLAPDSPIPSFTPEMLWADEVDPTAADTAINCTRAATARMNTLARQMEDWVIRYKLESMTDKELFATAEEIKEIYTTRRASR